MTDPADFDRVPLAIDLFCGLGGWTDGLLAEGYDVIGFDIERHEYGGHQYPAQLVLQDIRTLNGEAIPRWLIDEQLQLDQQQRELNYELERLQP